MSDFDKRIGDLLMFSKMCAPEYNSPELSDRVLVFDVMQDGWEASSILKSESATESNDAPNDILRETTSIQQSSDGLSEKLIEKLASPNPDTRAGSKDSGEPLRQHKIYIHSHWLSVQSPYFRSLLHSSGMKETRDSEAHMKIPESEENAHLTLVQAMYDASILNEKTVSELLAVLELTDKYDVKFVFNICKLVLQENATSLETSTQILHMIKEKHNMDDVEELAAILQLVVINAFSPLDENWQSEKFISLSELIVKYLLNSDDLIVQSENTVFHALMYWMEQNEIDPASLEETNDLITVVRFKLVTSDYLYGVIKNHAIASKMPRFDNKFLNGMIYHAMPSEKKKRLKEKPVLRRKQPDGIITQFSFAVKQEDYEAVHETGSELDTEEFWACGYKMSVSLIRDKKSYNIYPHLNVHNLNEESFVSLKFLVFGQNYSRYSNPWKEETFTLDICRKKYISCKVNDVPRQAENTIRELSVAVAPV